MTKFGEEMEKNVVSELMQEVEMKIKDLTEKCF